MSCGKLVDKEDLVVARAATREKRMLWNPGQGERDSARSDYVALHLVGLVGSLPITPWGDRSLLHFH